MTAARRGLLAALSGALLVLAFPGSGDQSWLAFGALAPLLVAVEGAPWRTSALLGFLSGVVFWLGTIPWLAGTMMRYGDAPWPLAILVLLGLVGYLALYPAAFCAVLSRVPHRSPGLYAIVAGSLWVALEFLRTYLLTGFPWNLLGYSQYRNLPLIQVAAITGVYGVSFVVVVANVAAAQVMLRRARFRELIAPVAAAAAVVALAVVAGWLAPWRATPGSMAPVALVQGSIEQGVKWDPDFQGATLETYRRLTLEAARERPLLIVWPETAVPFFLSEDPRRREVEALAREVGAYLLVGAPDRSDGPPRNSAFLVSPEGRFLGRYDKRHLVPFGEYVPLRRWLFFVNPLAGRAIGDFAAGGPATILPTSIGRVGVLICYEAIFPAEAREVFRAGAEVLVNITNDAWFGRSAAPVQHLAMAALRAVEGRAYLLRAANTGISALVAPDGRIVEASGLFTPQVLFGSIVPRSGMSPYTRYGDLFAWATVAVALAALWPVLLGRRVHIPWMERVTGESPSPRLSGRRRVLVSMLGGAGATAAALWAMFPRGAGDRGYQEVARWPIPGGHGRFIAVGAAAGLDELRALGERLRSESRRSKNVVVMVFDDPGAAREARRGSRSIGEARFQTALAHQRAMYVRHAGRGAESLVIYAMYPAIREVVRYVVDRA